MHTDQWLATGLQRGAFNHALLWNFHLANPSEVVNQATMPKPRLGNPEPKLGNPKPRLGAPKRRLGDPRPRLGAPKPMPGDHKTYVWGSEA